MATFEDGSGVAGSNTYITEAILDAYCEARNITPADGDVDAAGVRGSKWLDYTYRPRFQGQRVKLRDQGMEWPRYGVADASGFFVPYNAVPIEIIHAACEATLRELTAPGKLAPDLPRGGNIKEVGAGSAHVVFGANAQAQTTFQTIDGILAALLGSPNPYTARAVRGG